METQKVSFIHLNQLGGEGKPHLLLSICAHIGIYVNKYVEKKIGVYI